MATDTLNIFNSFKDDLAEGIHTLASDTLTVALCATANAPVATNGVLADLTTIAYTNLSSRVLTTTSSQLDGTTYELVLADLVLTASGGSAAAFQYVVIYNDTPTSPKADPLIGWLDYGSALTLANGETLTLDFSPTAGVLQIA